MIAIDTNALLRLVLGEPPEQVEAMRRLMESERVFVALTVILEAEWVLRSFYAYKKSDVVESLRGVIDLPQVFTEHKQRVDTALDWVEGGLQFADALHLASAEHCEAFATFDRPLAKRAERLAAVPVRLLGDS